MSLASPRESRAGPLSTLLSNLSCQQPPSEDDLKRLTDWTNSTCPALPAGMTAFLMAVTLRVPLQDPDDDIQSLLDARELSIEVINAQNGTIADLSAQIRHANAEKKRASAILDREKAKLKRDFEARMSSLRTSSETIEKTFRDEQTVLESEILRIESEIRKIESEIPPSPASARPAPSPPTRAAPDDLCAGSAAYGQFMADAPLVELRAVVQDILDPLIDWYSEVAGTRPAAPDTVAEFTELYGRMISEIRQINK